MGFEGSLVVQSGNDGIDFEFTVENVGHTSSELRFSDAQFAEFRVHQQNDTVWRYGEGRMFAQAVQSKHLEAGESMTMRATWEDPQSGDFECMATLTARDTDVVVSSSFTVDCR